MIKENLMMEAVPASLIIVIGIAAVVIIIVISYFLTMYLSWGGPTYPRTEIRIGPK